MAKFNLDDIQEQSYLETEGQHTLKIIKVAEDEDGNTTQVTANGNEFHKYVCETQNHEKIYVTLYILEKAMWKYKAFLSALGLDTKGLVFDSDTFDPESLVGKFFIGEVKRCPDKLNIETGLKEQSKYFEVVKFYPKA